MADKVRHFTDRIVVDAINASLATQHRVMDGRPIYRIVWGPDQLEKRVGTFTDWYGKILIRQEHKCLREVKKYWYHVEACWVLEKLVFMPRQAEMYDLLEELVEARNGTYEPVYTFQDGNGNPLPVVHEVVDCIIHAILNPTKRTESDWEAVCKREEQEEVEYFENQLGEESENKRSPLFVWENAAAVSTEQIKYREKLKLGQTYSEPTSPVVLA